MECSEVNGGELTRKGRDKRNLSLIVAALFSAFGVNSASCEYSFDEFRNLVLDHELTLTQGEAAPSKSRLMVAKFLLVFLGV